MIIKNDAEYRSFQPALNFSSLKSILASPRHYQAELRKEQEDKSCLKTGSALHEWTLEDLEAGDAKYVAIPDDAPRRPSAAQRKAKKPSEESSASIAWWDNWELLNADKVVLTPAELRNANRMSMALKNSADVQYLLSKCQQREIGIVQEYRHVTIKGRLDALGIDESGRYFIPDLKSSQSVAPEDFAKTCCTRKYFMQMMWYATLVSLEFKLDYLPPFYWIAVENSEAADVCIYSPPPEAIEIGQKQMDRAIELYQQCTASGKWPGYSNGIQELVLPAWQIRKSID